MDRSRCYRCLSDMPLRSVITEHDGTHCRSVNACIKRRRERYARLLAEVEGLPRVAVVVRSQEGALNSLYPPHLCFVNPKDPYRFNSAYGTYFTDPLENTLVEKIYPQPIGRGGTCEYDMEVAFYCDPDYCVKPKAPSADTYYGWVAPNGDWYPCRYNEHAGLASRLSAQFYGVLTGEEKLQEHGWHAVVDGGYLRLNQHFEYRVTQAQLDTLWDVASQVPEDTIALLGGSVRREVRKKMLEVVNHLTVY